MKDLTPNIILVQPEQLEGLARRTAEHVLAEVAPQPAPEILDVSSACAVLLVSRTTLHRWRSMGLPTHMVGDTPRFLRSELIAWIAEHRGTA